MFAVMGVIQLVSACRQRLGSVAETPAASAGAMPASPIRAGDRTSTRFVLMAPDATKLLAQLEDWRGRAAGHAPASAMPGTPELELMRLEAEAGNYAEAIRQADAMSGLPAAGTSAAPFPTEGLSAVDAVQAIASLAEGRRVVMINEAHHVPQHRALTIALLRVLRAKGFAWLAVETLYESDTLLASRGYPVPASGAYVNEPLYGDLVRTALALGYHVVPYDNGFGAGKADREERQAENLVRRVLQRDPAARLLVHAGYDHVNKSGLLAGVPPMAMAFRRLTGIEPLSVDQTVMTEHSAPEYEHSFYRRAAASLARPTVFLNNRGEPWTLDPTSRDVTVFSPRSKVEQGRPTWLRLGGTRVALPVDRGICVTAAHCIVEARPIAEPPDAVPMDRVEVRRGVAPPALMLPPGEFRITATTADGRLVHEARVQAGGETAAP